VSEISSLAFFGALYFAMLLATLDLILDPESP
jgi:hypothetical protein